MRVETVFLLRVSSSVDKEVDHPQFFDPPYALKHIQAGLEQYEDLKVGILDCWIYPMELPELLDRVRRENPDLIVVSSSSFDARVAHEFAVRIKEQEKPPLLVGIGQSHYLNHRYGGLNEEGYDVILLGEPDEEFFRLFEQIRDHGSAGRKWRDYYWKCYNDGLRFMIEEPDRLAFPIYTPEELEKYRSIFPVRISKRIVWGYLIATRGCPHGCVFCSEVMRVSISKRVRCRSAANVADEMAHLEKQGANICSFQDDSFSANRRFVKALCRELIRRKSEMPWMARVRVDELDYELLGLMKKAGCVMLGIGVESGSQRIIEEMQKRVRPKQWGDLCRKVFCWTRQLGIGTNAYYVIGNPTETADEIEQTIRLAMELNSDTIQVHFYTPYPGSKAWDQQKGFLENYDPTEMFHYATPLFTLARVSINDLVGLRSQFYRRYILRPRFLISHFRKHAGFYWHNPDILGFLLGIRKVFGKTHSRKKGRPKRGKSRMVMIGRVPRRCVNLPPGSLSTLIRSVVGGKVQTGPEVAAFEREFARWLNVPYVFGAQTGRSAFQLALEASNLRKGAEIIFPIFTFPVMPMVAQMLGYKSVFCEVDSETYNSGPEHIEPLITEKTGAVLATHLYGQPCPIAEIRELTRSRGILLFEDCAHACGANVDGQKVGTFGEIGIFSFAEGKNMPCFGGGAIAVRDAAIAERARKILENALLPHERDIKSKAYGIWFKWLMTRPLIFGLSAFQILRLKLMQGKPLMDSAVGNELIENFLKAKPSIQPLSNLQASIGLLQLNHIDLFNDGARENAKALTEKLGQVPGLRVPAMEGNHIYVYYPIYVDPKRRDDLRHFLLRNGIDTKRTDMADCSTLTPFQGSKALITRRNGPSEASVLEICVYPVIAKKEMHRIARLIRTWAGLK